MSAPLDVSDLRITSVTAVVPVVTQDEIFIVPQCDGLRGSSAIFHYLCAGVDITLQLLYR